MAIQPLLEYVIDRKLPISHCTDIEKMAGVSLDGGGLPRR